MLRNKTVRRHNHLLKAAGFLALLLSLATLMITTTGGARAQEQSRRHADKFLKSQGANAIPGQYIVALRDDIPGSDDRNIIQPITERLPRGGGGFCRSMPVKEPKLGDFVSAATREYSAAFNSISYFQIPVYFHVIQDINGNGYVDESRLDAQINVLNSAFNGATVGANVQFFFWRAGVTWHYHRDWFNMERDSLEEYEAKAEMRQGGANALNFYTISGTPKPGFQYPFGWARFASEYASKPCLDGVVAPVTTLPGVGNGPYNEGKLGVHEVGHWLGLYHTFHDPLERDNCAYVNDEVDDTPAHLNRFIGECPSDSTDTCTSAPGFDPIHNFMTNTSDACRTHFTRKQFERMANEYLTYRQSSTPPQCPVASVAWVAPSESTWGPPNTLTVAGHAFNGSGGVEMIWKDKTENGALTSVGWQPTPNPTDHTWSNTIPSPNKCHEFEVYVRYSGYESRHFIYNGKTSGYCNESVKVIWIQPQSSAGFGPPGSLIIAGSAAGAPLGTQVYVRYRDLTARTGWVYHPYAPLPNTDGYWFTDIPNADFSHAYQVYATYSSVANDCYYWGGNQISWCQ